MLPAVVLSLKCWERFRLNQYKVEGRRSSVVFVISVTIFLFYVLKKESVLLFWESVLVVHLRDPFVLTESPMPSLYG